MNKQWQSWIRLAIVTLLATGLFNLTWADSHGGKSVPIKGFASGYLIGFNQDPTTWPPGRCDDEPDGFFTGSLTTFEGWGDLSHLGWTHFLVQHCSYLPIDPEGIYGTYGQGTMTLTADNGDVLVGTYDNGVSLTPPPLIVFMDYIEFTDGGTGRFTYASGEAVEVGLFNFDTFAFSVQLEGRISYKRKMK